MSRTRADAGQTAEGMPLLALLKEDLARHGGKWGMPGFQALAVHRLGHWAHGRPGLAAKVARRLHRHANGFVRNFYGIEIHERTRIGRRLHIGHQHGITVHPLAYIGDDCVLRHNVTLGVGVAAKNDRGPRIGDGVEFSPGAVVLGGVTIGDGVRLGPNVLVTTNVAAGSVVFEKPTRIVRLTKGPAPDVDLTTPQAGTSKERSR